MKTRPRVGQNPGVGSCDPALTGEAVAPPAAPGVARQPRRRADPGCRVAGLRAPAGGTPAAAQPLAPRPQTANPEGWTARPSTHQDPEDPRESTARILHHGARGRSRSPDASPGYDHAKIPRLSLAHLPTPIEPLPRLSAALGGPRLFIKRDDQTGLALGGNKTRKLEFLVAEAQAQGRPNPRHGGRLAVQSLSPDGRGGGALRDGLHPGVDRRAPRRSDRESAARSTLDARIVATPDRRDRDRLLRRPSRPPRRRAKRPTWFPTAAAARPEHWAMPLRCRRFSRRGSRWTGWSSPPPAAAPRPDWSWGSASSATAGHCSGSASTSRHPRSSHRWPPWRATQARRWATHRLRRRGRARRRPLLRTRLRGADRPRARGDPARGLRPLPRASCWIRSTPGVPPAACWISSAGGRVLPERCAHPVLAHRRAARVVCRAADRSTGLRPAGHDAERTPGTFRLPGPG
jgi:hypothetical protein